MKNLIGPQLKVVVTKGPTSGLSSEFHPRTKVNVGRVVKGNKVTIKDAGVSSKHLSLQFDSGSGHWTLTDLDSSNGTLLNSEPIDPSTPYPLRDGDVIKFGEESAFQVAIQENVAPGGRVTRQRARLGVIKEETQLGLGFDVGLGKKEITKDGVIEEKNQDIAIGKEGVIEEEKELGVVEKNEKKVGKGRVKKNQNIAIRKKGVIEEERELQVGVVEELGKNENGNAEIGKEGEGLESLGENVVDGGKLGVSEELGVEEESGKNEKQMGRGMVKKNENTDIGKEGESLESLGESEVKDAGLRRVTRGSRRKGNNGAETGKGIGAAGTGRVRSSGIQEMYEIRGYDANMDVVEKGRSKGNDGAENGEGIVDACTDRVTRGGRITRSSRIQEMSEIRGYHDRGAANMDVVEKGRRKGTARRQKRTGTTSVENSGLGENVVEGGLVVNSEVVNERSRRNCTKVRKKLEVEVKAPESLENGQIREEEMGLKSHLQEGDCGEGENNGEGDQVESMQEDVCGDGSTNRRTTNLNVLSRLEKMTLGQWLDYIEEYLPKQIVVETEEMITEMRRKAEKFHEFMLQQKAAKGGVEDIH